MRFNSRACALMDIPDLPAMAFQHIGDKKIKPQGGGGSFNPIAAITDPISSALGTDGGGGGILGAVADIDPGPSIGSALASVDPGPAIGSGLADVDDFVNDEIPGGWYTVGLAAATAGAAAYAAPAAGAAGTGAAGAGAAGGAAAGSGLSAAELLAVGGFAPTAGSAASFTVPSAIAAGAGAGGSIGGIELGGAFLPTAGSEASFAVPGLLSTSGISVTPEVTSALNTANTTLPNIPGTVPYTPSSFGTLTPPLTGSGAVPGAMSTAIPGAGLTGALPAGVLVGDGTLGTTLGATYMAAGPTQFAVNTLGNAIPASSIGIDGFAPATSLGIKEALDVARLGKNLLAENPATPAGATAQFRGSTIPQGGVDYSGILNLLQTRSAQRNPYSLLG